MERTDELKERIRQQPLNDRLEESRRRIGDMCSKGLCPKMTIPVQHDDDDFYINTTLADAQATIAALQAQLPEEMQHCTIVFKECEKGHGRLTATNWIDHGCDTCRIEQRTAELEAANKLLYRKNCALGRAETIINDLQAELERVSLLSSHNERRFEEVDKKYKELREQNRVLAREYTRLFNLAKPIATLLQDLKIILIGCSREQELAWKRAVKNFRHYQQWYEASVAMEAALTATSQPKEAQ